MKLELTQSNTHGFYFGIEYKYNNIVEKWFKDNIYKYSVEQYGIFWEVATDGRHKQTAGQHVHILIYSTTSQDICKTSDNMKKKMKQDIERELNVKFLGQAKDGNARQYGVASISQLRNPINYFSYCMKEKDIYNINYLTKELKDLSITIPEWNNKKKDDKAEWFFELQKLLEEKNHLTIHEHYNDRKQTFNHTLEPHKTARMDIAEIILEIYLEKKLRPPTKSQMDAFIKYHQLHYLKISKYEFINTWYYSDNF